MTRANDNGLGQWKGEARPLRLRLYVSDSYLSRSAVANVQRLLEEAGASEVVLEVFDILEYLREAQEDNILATPTLLRLDPPPVRRLLGDLSDHEKVKLVLGLL